MEGRPSELLITDTKVCLTFAVGDKEKPLGRKLVAQDLNFGSVDSTSASIGSHPALEGIETRSLKEIV
ncbi:MAG: hypothetical protein M1357_00945 [Candidatus Marsarchaeota archaeon]|nr:hypothetical protein [Candidatus Marsarchaeota archaeon]